jgi:hypothetical protein
MRGLYYGGYAIRLTYELIFESFVRIHDVATIGLFALASVLNLYNFNKSKSRIGSWQAVASNNKGLIGSWWFGGGDGEWFAFLGHNGNDETTIIPACLLEQMTVEKKVD